MTSAIIGIQKMIGNDGLQKPVSHARCSKPKQAIHKAVTFSRNQIGKLLGRYKSSKKKIIEEISKKQVKNGPKRRVLTGLTSEIGRPQAIKKGKDIKDIKSCNCMLFKSDCCQRV
jgi:hypothetical protein